MRPFFRFKKQVPRNLDNGEDDSTKDLRKKIAEFDAKIESARARPKPTPQIPETDEEN